MSEENGNTVEEQTTQEAQNPESNTEEQTAEQFSIPKEEYENLKATVGSLSRDLKKALQTNQKGDGKSSSQKEQKADDNNLLQKTFLRAAGISSQEEVDLALETAQKWGMSVDTLVDDADFKLKLDKLRTDKSNEIATTGVKGNKTGNSSSAKETVAYWKAKGALPTPDDVPDRKTRVKIIHGLRDAENSQKMFYNE